MKIALISNYEPDGSNSMLRYGRMLKSKLRERGYDVLLLHPPALLGRLPLSRGGPAKWIGYIDKFVIAPWYLRWKSRNADVVHICDHSNAMYLWCAGSRPHVITCHDVIAVRAARGEYPGIETRGTGRLLQWWIATSLQRARYVLCDSHKTESDLQALAPHMPASLRVVYLSLNRNCAPADQEQVRQAKTAAGMDAGAEYLLHVGGPGWYKNRAGAIRIFAELKKAPEFAGMKLLLAGKARDERERALCRQEGIEAAVLEAQRVSDETLQGLYTGAQALLFPSLTEGFGWPVLEAQACGCPVITSNRPPMTEVTGDAAILIDPTEVEAAARIIREQWPRRAALREAGLRNAAGFSEERMMEGYTRAYEEVVAAWRTRAVAVER
ncbi:MAG: glycosyltransferase family 1 protein [Acidobacteriaceae bacterium]